MREPMVCILVYIYGAVTVKLVTIRKSMLLNEKIKNEKPNSKPLFIDRVTFLNDREWLRENHHCLIILPFTISCVPVTNS